MLLTIYDRYGSKKTTLEASDSSTQVKELQSDNVLTLTFTLYEHLALEVNDYIDYQGERYWLLEAYQPSQKSTVEWDYDVKLYGIESLIKRFLVLKTVDGENEPVFTLTAPPRDHVAMIVKCINEGMGGDTNWKVGTVEGTENIVIDYGGTYCDEGLKAVADAVGSEYWIEVQTVNICRCEHGEELTIGYGNGITGIEKDTADNVKFYTRLFPKGSSRNIDVSKYGYSCLQLPDKAKYVDVNTDKYGIIHHYESAAFAGIYPRRTGVVSNVRSEEYKGDDGKMFTIYYFTDNDLPFDPNEYEISQLVKRISFQEGSELAGIGKEEDGTYYLECNYDSKTKEFELITIWPNDDDTQLPGGALIPKPGDKYILWNISMPDAYYTLAEEEYLAAVKKYNEDNAIDVAVYKCPTDHVWIENSGEDLFVGRRVCLVSDEYFPEFGKRSSRITKISRKVNVPGLVDIEISDAISTGTMKKLSNDINDAKNYSKGLIAGISLPDIIRSWETTPPTDNNLFSALRILAEIAGKAISKKKDDTAEGVITFLNGLLVGDGTKGIDKNGNANLLSLILGKFGITEQGVANLLSVISNKFESLNFKTGVQGSGLTIKIDENGDSYIEIDRALFRKSATFVEIIIQSLKHVGGQIILTPASMHCIKVESYSTYYRCYFRDSDGDKTIFNEFVVGDMARSQTFNIKAGVSHNVSNGYYWRKVVGVGDDYIDLSKTDCDAGSTVPQPYDDIVQLGNESDVTRQAALVLSAFGNDAPYLKFYKGINSYSMTGKEIVNISRSEVSIIADKFKFSTGESVKDYIDGIDNDITTTVSILEGMFKSEVSSIRTESNQNNNILYNSSFAENTYGWSVANGTSLFQVSKEFLWFNKAFYANKTNVAEVSTYDSRWVLRIKSSSISQLNSSYYLHPTFVKSEDKDGNILSAYSPKKFYLSFWGKVTSGGTLAVNFANTTGGDTFTSFDRMSINETLSVDSEYRLYEYSGLWDGKGDITISFSGDMLLFNLSFSEDKYDSISTKFDTKIIQTDRKIQSLVTQVETNANGIESNASSITQTAKAIRSEVSSSVSTLDGKISANTSSITQTNNSITALTKKISFDSSGKITNISTSGLVTTSTFAGLFSQNVDSNGLVKSAQISAFITADEAGNLISKAAIRADQINLTGAVTFAMFNSALQSTINSKANSSDLTADKISGLGTLAKLNSVGMGNLATVIQNNINSISGKATAADISTAISNLGLGNISKLNEIGYSNLATALKNSIDAIGGKIDSSYLSNNGYINNLVSALTNQVAIAGGFIKASMIDVDSLYVKHLSGADGDFTGKVTATSGKIGNMGIDSNGAMSGAGQTFTDIPTYTSFVSSSDESSFKYRIANKIIWNFMKTEVIVLCPDFVGINPSASFYVVNLPTATTVINAGKAYCGFPLKIIAHRNKKYNSNGEVVCLNNVCYRITSNSRVKETSSFPGFEANTSYSVPNGELCNNDGDYVSYIDMTDGDILELYYINGVYHITNRRS